MAKVKSAFEKAMEKAAEIGEFTEEEKEKLREQEKLKTLLAEFYKGKLDRNGLWKELKGSKPTILREAQNSLADSIGLSSIPEEFQKRKDGILAIENLKEVKNTSAIEHILHVIETIQKEYKEKKEIVADELREEIERNPQLRLQPVRTANGKTAFQAALSVDEAVQARLTDFLAEHERIFSQEFTKMIYALKKEIK
jgi:hypothetical protein